MADQVLWPVPQQGGSGAASFGQGDGRAGSAAFAGAAEGVGHAGPAHHATPGSTSGSSSKRGFWDLKSLQQQLQGLGLAGVTVS